MKKKIIAVLSLISFLAFGSNVKAAETPGLDPENEKLFFANGVAITIEERTDGNEGALIKWDGGELLVPANINVFGAGHNTDTYYEEISITMNGGTVRNIIGGGLHKSNVGTTNIVMNGGKINSINGGGAASLVHCHTWYAGNAEDSNNRVETSNVTVNNGVVTGIVYGGGEGISYTGSANIKIENGTFAYVIAGGSNGYTGSSEVVINGGKINIVQSVNRGSMEFSYIEINGGEIENAYVGGDASDASVTGTIENANMDIIGGKVENAYVGTNGGQNVSAKDVVTLAYNKNAVTNIDEAEFDEENIIRTVTLTFSSEGETESVQVPEGIIFTEEDVENLKNQLKDALADSGYVFEDFYSDEEMTVKYDFSAAFDDDTTIFMKLVAAPAEEVKSPETSDINLIAIISIILIGVAGAVLTSRKVFLKNK